MTKLFKVDVFFNGVSTYMAEGEEVEFQGRRMVHLPHGVIVESGGYQKTVADAKRAAANRIDAIRVDLAGEAAKLRAEADAMEGKEALA